MKTINHWADYTHPQNGELTGDMKSSIFTDGFRHVTDFVGRSADDRQIFPLELRWNSEGLPAGSVELWRHVWFDADPWSGISPHVAFYLVTNLHVAVARSKLHIFH